MREVVAGLFVSLDGVAEQPDQFVTDMDGAMEESLARGIAAQDSVLLGRRTYDDWAGFWPDSAVEPFASFINGVQKFVVTSTPLETEWAQTAVVEGGLAEFVTELKQQHGGDIGVHGSIALTQSLLKAGLLDELRLVIAPVVQVHGRKLFDRASAGRLSLIRSVATETGYLLADYQVSGVARPQPRLGRQAPDSPAS
jgi:dihydrofolate reductase